MDVSLSRSLAGLATNQADRQYQTQLGAAVLKQTLEQDKQAGAALVKMIEETPRPHVAVPHVDFYAKRRIQGKNIPDWLAAPGR